MRLLARNAVQRLSNHQRQCAAAPLCITKADGRRHIQIQAAPSSVSSGVVENTPSSASSPGKYPHLFSFKTSCSYSARDAVFEVVGTPYSLLSVSLFPSQPLHTRRGTLVGLSGDPSTAVSTLSLLSPLRRALIGIPFLYQRLTSTTPITALIAPKSTCTSLAVLHLTGIIDWKIAQRKALLAWTGSTLTITPSLNRRLSLAHWGTTTCTGRGLLALAGMGNLFSIDLAENESYIAHPSNILAYSVSSPIPPRPYRFKSSSFNLQIPGLPSPYNFGNFFPSSRFVTSLKDSDSYKTLASIYYRIRTWSRRTIWGDRLFLQFTGPTTILIQSRGSRVSDVLTNRDVNEIADAPPGAVGEAVRLDIKQQEEHMSGAGAGATTLETVVRKPLKLSIASVQRDGNVRIEETDDFEQLKR